MVSIDFDASELNRLAVDLGARTATVGAGASLAVRKTAQLVERDGKAFAPVDTGNLRSSISTTVMGDGRFGSIAAEIGPTVDYGEYVELGTSRMAPAAYMGPAFDRNAHYLETALLNLAEVL